MCKTKDYLMGVECDHWFSAVGDGSDCRVGVGQETGPGACS